jgi:CRP-like cAMP-binding protein
MAGSLSDVAIFRPLSDEALAALAARGKRRTFQPGSVLMRQGEPSETLHVVLTGRVRVERTGEATVALAELGPNETVGEMGVLDHAPRSATVTAIEDTETLELHATALAIVIIQNPVVAATLLRVLSRRLRNTAELVDQLARESH